MFSGTLSGKIIIISALVFIILIGSLRIASNKIKYLRGKIDTQKKELVILQEANSKMENLLEKEKASCDQAIGVLHKIITEDKNNVKEHKEIDKIIDKLKKDKRVKPKKNETRPDTSKKEQVTPRKIFKEVSYINRIFKTK